MFSVHENSSEETVVTRLLTLKFSLCAPRTTSFLDHVPACNEMAQSLVGLSEL